MSFFPMLVIHLRESSKGRKERRRPTLGVSFIEESILQKRPLRQSRLGKILFKQFFQVKTVQKKMWVSWKVVIIQLQQQPFLQTLLANNNIIHLINNNTKINQQQYSGTLYTNCSHICSQYSGSWPCKWNDKPQLQNQSKQHLQNLSNVRCSLLCKLVMTAWKEVWKWTSVVIQCSSLLILIFTFVQSNNPSHRVYFEHYFCTVL